MMPELTVLEFQALKPETSRGVQLCVQYPSQLYPVVDLVVHILQLLFSIH